MVNFPPPGEPWLDRNVEDVDVPEVLYGVWFGSVGFRVKSLAFISSLASLASNSFLIIYNSSSIFQTSSLDLRAISIRISLGNFDIMPGIRRLPYSFDETPSDAKPLVCTLILS